MCSANGYLSCWESKSGNIERLLLRFWLRKQCFWKICDAVYSAAQNKEVICCGGYPMAHVIRGCLARTEDFSWPLTPAKGFFHITVCCGELGSVVEHLIVDKSLNYMRGWEVFEKNSEIRSSSSRFEYCSESLIWPIGSHIWSLFAPIYMKSWPKVKLGQVQVGSNIAQNHSSSP